MTKKISRNYCKLSQRTENRWKITKGKRIAQVSFQAKIDASNESTARSKSREIQTQQLMPVRVSR